MAAAIRFLRRRPAASPSLAALQPLFPAPYSKARPPLMAAATVPRFFPGVGPAQSSPHPVLRHYSSKKQPLSAVQAAPTTAPNLLDVFRVQLSRPQIPYMMVRQYSSKAERCHNHNTIRYTETEVMIWFRAGVLKDMDKVIKMEKEALKTILEASDLIYLGCEEKGFSMLEKGIDDALKGVALHEKAIDNFAKGFGSIKGVPVDILEPHQMCCKELENALKSMRQEVKEQYCYIRTLKKLTKWLSSVNVGLGACLSLLLLVTTGIYLFINKRR
ncbi:hypothetical protein ACP4OV_019269 [Aristida adscensionis]